MYHHMSLLTPSPSSLKCCCYFSERTSLAPETVLSARGALQVLIHAHAHTCKFYLGEKRIHSRLCFPPPPTRVRGALRGQRESDAGKSITAADAGEECDRTTALHTGKIHCLRCLLGPKVLPSVPRSRQLHDLPWRISPIQVSVS